MNCIKCDAEIENDDNFCHKCGHWTTVGYMHLKDNNNREKLKNGSAFKKNDRMATLFSLVTLFIIALLIMLAIQGKDILRPIAYIKKEVFYNLYGYKSTLIKTDNIYKNKNINSLEEATALISKDSNEQKWQCEVNLDRNYIESNISKEYNIVDVNLCDIPLPTVERIANVIKRMNQLFPNTTGYLTNVSITNSNSFGNFVAYFQPIYKFANGTSNINKYNLVNKTQILLNSYYFLNEEILNDAIIDYVSDNWYVKGVTWDSVIAHEYGHYILFVSTLKDNGIDNLTFITSDNYKKYSEVLEKINSSEYANEILEMAVTNFNLKYNLNSTTVEFANEISNYAASKEDKGNIIAEETIAEAIHDYYLHETNSSRASLEIISIIKTKLGGA